MKTSKEVEKEFLEKFDALLKEYGANFSCDDEWQGYSECGQDIHARFDIPSIYQGNGECIREYTDIDIGNYRRYK